MKKLVALYNQEFQSSSGPTPQWMTFFNTFKREFKKALEARGCTSVEISKGHFYVSGFFTAPNGQYFYFNVGDVRWSFSKKTMYYRTAKNYKDYTGGQNRNLPFTVDVVEKMNFEPDPAPKAMFQIID